MKSTEETVKPTEVRGKIGSMTKPCELAVFPFIEDEWTTSEYRGVPVHSRFDGWRTPSGDVPEMFIDSHVAEKRFAEAELAAEFEAARCDAMIHRAIGSYWAPLGETWPTDYDSACNRATTLLRFASRPHHDEATQ